MVRIKAPGPRQGLDHGVEALDCGDRVQLRVGRRDERQVDAGHLGRRRQEHPRPLEPEVVGQGEQARLGRAARGEDQEREALLHDGHGAVPDLGAREGLGLDAAGLLQFEGRLAGDGEAGAPPQDEQPVHADKGLGTCGPVHAGGGLQGGRQGLQARSKGRVLLPGRDDPRPGHELPDE